MPQQALRPGARPAAQLRRQHDRGRAGNGDDLAYALYVLARNGRPVMGDLRYLADTKLEPSPRRWRAPSSPRRWRCSATRPRADGVRRGASSSCARERDGGVAGPTTARGCATAPGMLALVAEAGERARRRSAAIARGRSRSERRDAATPARRRMPGWCSPPRRCRATRTRSALDGRRRAAQGRAVPDLARRGARRQASDDRQRRRRAGAGRRDRRPATRSSPSRRRAGLHDRAAATTSSTARSVDPAQRAPERAARGVAQGDRGEAAVARAAARRPAAGRASRSTIRSWSTAGDDRRARLAQTDVEPAHTEFRDDRFVAAFDRQRERLGLLHRRLHGARRGARAATSIPPAMVEDMYRPERFGRTGLRRRRGRAGAP